MGARDQNEPNLFGTRPRKTPERPKAPSGAMARLIGQYRDGYAARFNEPPVFTPRDSRMLKTLVLQFGEAVVSQRLAVYLAWDDRYAAESGYAIHVMYSSWSRLTALVKAKERDAGGNGRVLGVEASKAYLAKMRRRDPE